MSSNEINRALTWLYGDDTGLSSITIHSVMTGNLGAARMPMPPSDPSDFRRCHRLLELMPEWRPRLGEVADAHPEWRRLIDNWDRLTAMYVAGNYTALYAAIRGYTT